MNIQPGDRLALVVMGDQVALRPLGGTLLELRGSVAVDSPQDLPAVRRKAKVARASKRVQDGD